MFFSKKLSRGLWSHLGRQTLFCIFINSSASLSHFCAVASAYFTLMISFWTICIQCNFFGMTLLKLQLKWSSSQVVCSKQVACIRGILGNWKYIPQTWSRSEVVFWRGISIKSSLWLVTAWRNRGDFSDSGESRQMSQKSCWQQPLEGTSGMCTMLSLSSIKAAWINPLVSSLLWWLCEEKQRIWSSVSKKAVYQTFWTAQSLFNRGHLLGTITMQFMKVIWLVLWWCDLHLWEGFK